eukprot:TRINITY_DN19178_c1_g1_i1.p1 TRINITY_DN19178_c1_g1~~TRINITY_DN19178_c1_g1_i1.p1  ORF type:complete len:332 (+),score=88.08 TRINITY_DN19178_c1_g1_i1:89-997(+)
MGRSERARKLGASDELPAVAPEDAWEVYIVDLTPGSGRKPTALRCSSGDTVSRLRRRLALEWGVSAASLRLLLSGEELTIYDDSASIVNRGIRDGTTVDAFEVRPPQQRQPGWFARWIGQVIPSLAPCCTCDTPERRGSTYEYRASDDAGGGAAGSDTATDDDGHRTFDGDRVPPERSAPIDGVMQALGPGGWPCGAPQCAPVILPPLGRELSGRILSALAAAVFAFTPAVLRDIRLPNRTQARLDHQFQVGLASSGARVPGCLPSQPGGLSLASIGHGSRSRSGSEGQRRGAEEGDARRGR